MSSTSSQSSQTPSLQDLNKKWSELEKKLSTLLGHKNDSNSLGISKQFSEKISEIIQIFTQTSKTLNSGAFSIKEGVDDVFIRKIRSFLYDHSKILKDSSFYQIKDIIGQNLQLVSSILMKFYCYGSIIGLILKCESECKTMNIEEIRNFHIFALDFVSFLALDKNFLEFGFFNFIQESFQTNNSSLNHVKLLIKLFKYCLVNAYIFHDQDDSLFELCEVFLFKILRDNENMKGFPEIVFGVLGCFFKIMGQKYLIELYNMIKKAEFNDDFQINVDKIFFLNCGNEIRKIIFEGIKKQKPEKNCEFFEILKPLFFNDLLHLHPKSQFSFEKITENDHLCLSDQILSEFIIFFDDILVPDFQKYVQMIEQGPTKNDFNSNIENFEGLVSIITNYFLNENFKKTNFQLLDFLISLEKSYKVLIPPGNYQKTINKIIKCLYEIILVKNNSDELKFQDTFKLFSIVAKDNSMEGMVNLSKFLRILSFTTIPSNYKTQIDSFYENDLPQLFEKMFFHKDPIIKYSGLHAMEIFSSSEKLEKIDFLFRKTEVLVDFQSFLSLQIIENSENLKISQEILNVLNDVFEHKIKKNSIEFGFITEFLEEKENKRKTEEIFKNLKELIKGMKPKNLDLMKKNFLELINDETKNL